MSRADELTALFGAISNQATEALDTLDGWGLPDAGTALSLRGMSRALATLSATAAGACQDEAARFPAEDVGYRRGGFVVTISNRRFWPLDPRPDEVDLFDMAHALSLKNRFGCMSLRPYSVAEHSLFVGTICRVLAERAGIDADLAFAHGALHDGEEAYLPDIPRPIKPYIPGWGRIAARVQDAILEAIGIGPPTAEIAAIVKRADDTALIIEARSSLFDSTDELWAGGLPEIEVIDFGGFEPPHAGDRALPWHVWRSRMHNVLKRIAHSCTVVRDVRPEPNPDHTQSWRAEVKETGGSGRCKVCGDEIDTNGDVTFALCGSCLA